MTVQTPLYGAVVIEVEGLTKRFGSTLAVDALSFRVEPGRLTGFLGPNGAGKTTTLRVVLGLVRPTAGSARVLGQAYADLDSPTRRVGAVLETSSFHPGRSGRNHLRVIAAAGGIRRSRLEEVLELVQLAGTARRRVKTYSLGMRQRLSLAVALLGDPEVLVLDEPANGLDPQGMRWLRDLLRALSNEGRTILVSSHVLAEVEQLADDVVIIDRGRLVAQAPVAEIAARASGGTLVRTPAPEQLRDVLTAAELEVVATDGGRLTVAAPPDRVGELAAQHGIVLHELRAETATLEEGFLELIAGGGST
jgi:ABC-2 type transport system ATP-binding protein